MYAGTIVNYIGILRCKNQRIIHDLPIIVFFYKYIFTPTRNYLFFHTLK